MERQQDRCTASVDRGSVFFLAIFGSADGANFGSASFFDNVWFVFEENARKIAYLSANWCDIAPVFGGNPANWHISGVDIVDCRKLAAVVAEYRKVLGRQFDISAGAHNAGCVEPVDGFCKISGI